MSKKSTFLVCFAAVMFAICPQHGSGFDRDVIISVYQGPCRDGDFDSNLQSARNVVKQALAAGSDFLALPETFLSGYDTPENMRRGARRLDDPELQKFIAETAAHAWS